MAHATTHSAFRTIVAFAVSAVIPFGTAAQSSAASGYHLDVSQLTGAPGSVVTVSTFDLAPDQSYRIAIGALGFGFEELGWVMADADGNLSVEVEIPHWAPNDAIHRFILNDLYQRPMGFSGLFHVTDAEGDVQREGRVAASGDGGLLLIGVDEVSYVLEGDVGGLVPGSEVVIDGPVVDSCECTGAATIQVQSASPLRQSDGSS